MQLVYAYGCECSANFTEVDCKVPGVNVSRVRFARTPTEHDLDNLCFGGDWIEQVEVLSQRESSQRRAVMFPPDGTASVIPAPPPLTAVEIVIVKDR